MGLGRIALFVLAAFGVLFVVRMFLRLRGLAPEQIAGLKARGAQMVDVRTSAEFSSGHAGGSKNIPLDRLQERLGELDRNRPVLVCCATGSRSALAKTLLERAGFSEVHNAGPWTSLR
jgi:rhodanese-related sulfurtransferase